MTPQPTPNFQVVNLGWCYTKIQHSKDSDYPSYIHDGIKHKIPIDEVVRLKMIALYFGQPNPWKI